MKNTPYTLASYLKEIGYQTTANPYEDAKSGKIVFMLVVSRSEVAVCQRSFYQRLLSDKMPIKEARSGRIDFDNGGKIIICSPDTTNSFFLGYDKLKSVYAIYRS